MPPPPILIGTLAGAGLGTIYGWLRTRPIRQTLAELRDDLIAAPNTHAQEAIADELIRARLLRIARISLSAFMLAALGTAMVTIIRYGL